MAMSLSSTFTGRVTSVNDKGLKLDGHDEWYNVSKFAPAVVLPERGQTVTVAVDGKGFLRSCELVDAATAMSGNGATSGTYGAHNATSGQSDLPLHGSAAQRQRDRTITRLAVLKAAAEYAASKPQSSSGDVLKIAACWERWVLRSEDPTEDNVDAF